MYIKLIYFTLILSLIIPFPDDINALSSEPILITQSPDMEQVIFDGKWTFFSEWKPTSLTSIGIDGRTIIVRTAHFEDFIYIFINPINDFTLDKGSDKATICFDGNNNKNLTADKDDFCFSSTFGHKQGITFQGGSINAITGNFQRISNPVGFIAISNVSDYNDRYTKIPHPSYEFKIPIDLIQRSDNYGFYLSVFDASTDTFYSFPTEPIRENYFKIPSPILWGDIISPDKSLPEFPSPLLFFTIIILSFIVIQTRLTKGNFRCN